MLVLEEERRDDEWLVGGTDSLPHLPQHHQHPRTLSSQDTLQGWDVGRLASGGCVTVGTRVVLVEGCV